MIVLATPTIPVTVILLMTAVGCLGFLLDAWKTIRKYATYTMRSIRVLSTSILTSLILKTMPG